MIGDVLVTLKNLLNSHYRTLLSGPSEYIGAEKVVFVEGDLKNDQIPFKLEAISIILFNIEQEKAFRQVDPYTRISSDGLKAKTQPDLAFNLYLLFVARFTSYEQGLHYLSLLIKYFQSNNYLDHHNTPGLSEDIDHLILELFNLSITQQNELWGSLRTSYLPSVAYKVKTVIFRTEETLPLTDVAESFNTGKQL